jgi:predicted ArsR family transcriptional regulator
MGGEYEVGPGGSLECHNCLFAEVCRRAPLVCSFHAGLIEGLLERSMGAIGVESLGQRGPDGCAYVVNARERAASIGSEAAQAS